MSREEIFAAVRERTLEGGCPPEEYDEYVAELIGRGYTELDAHKTANAVLGLWDVHKLLAKLDEEGE